MKTILRLFVMIGFIVVIPGIGSFCQVGINSDGNSPDPSAGLDVKFSDKGLLIPRVSLTSTTSNSPIGSGIATSLMVYNTATNSYVTPGYYYWTGTSWNRVATGGFVHYVGELFGGGMVVAVWKESGIEKDLIVSLVNISSGTGWSNMNETGIGEGVQDPVNGQANSITIMAQSGHISSAAKLCDDYVNADYGTGIFSDWYLPAVWELTQCYNAAFFINSVLGPFNGIQYNWQSNYWSSNEYYYNESWAMSFFNGTMTFPYKNSSLSVLAVRRSFSIGNSYGGGKIFYIDGTGQHGLISANDDQGFAPWGCDGTSIGTTTTAIGTGQANTNAIVGNGCSTSGIAAKICDELVLNGYSDWFLPSKDELHQMILQGPVIGGFNPSFYWTSSEYDANNAWVEQWGIGASHFSKTESYRVRAIRAF